MGRNYPCIQEREKSHVCSINKEIPNKYAYVSNLCVSKAARRQGVASNMLKFAVETARSSGIIQREMKIQSNYMKMQCLLIWFLIIFLVTGIEQVYVHVHRNNTPARVLYEKIGFEVIIYSHI